MLNAIGGSAELIAEVVPRDHPEEQVRMGARRIQRSAAGVTRLVGDLVDVASIHAGKLAVAAEVGDPTPVVLEAVETFLPQAAAGGVALLTEIVQPSSTVAFDPARLPGAHQSVEQRAQVHSGRRHSCGACRRCWC